MEIQGVHVGEERKRACMDNGLDLIISSEVKATGREEGELGEISGPVLQCLGTLLGNSDKR